MTIKTKGALKVEAEIDPKFLFVCEPDSVKAVSYSCSEPALCGAKIKENKIIATFKEEPPQEITLKLVGVRKGQKNIRFEARTKEQEIKNTAFWISPYR